LFPYSADITTLGFSFFRLMEIKGFLEGLPHSADKRGSGFRLMEIKGF
jgi:hypothetical protein